MAIDKSLRQHYEMQGGVKNYLGKQKMVKAPKKWKSGPDHPDTELAYITKAEKDLILKADLHNSLSKGPNQGPSGIISLNSAGSGYGGPGPGSSGDSGGGGGGGDNWRANLQHTYSAPAPAPAPVTDYEGEAYGTPDTIASLTPGPSPHGDGEANIQEQKKLDIQQMIAKQQEEKYDVPVDPTKFGETITKLDVALSKPENERTIDDKLEIEKWEKDQDWDKVKELADKGESFKDIQAAMDKGLLLKQDAIRRQGLIERGLAAIKPKTKLESSLLPTMTKEGLAGFAKDQLGKMAFNLGAKKLGLGSLLSFINPFLALASFIPGLKGKVPRSAYDLAKNIKSNIKPPSIGTKKTPKKLVKGPPKDQGGDGENLIKQVAGGEDVVTKAINQYAGTEVEGKIQSLVQNNLNQALGYYANMHSRIEKGYSPNRQEMDVFKLLEHYLNEAAPKQQTVNVAYGGRIDKPLTGRSRDI